MTSVLFVDDEENILNGIRRTLHQMGGTWEFLYATNGEEARDILEGPEHVDFVVTDIMMPGMNGYELIETIMDKYPDIKPIVISGKCDATDRLEFERMNIPFFKKPFSTMELALFISKQMVDQIDG
ncbi:response regulator [Terasakiella sp. SH-1]|uniref:response regulator n=1 Tax=Terasakiella sp. SH-1 TaxID=2560057 RepID=UPI0010746748|nr:response regulator [Terasakiella sp. SH-1]